MNTYEFFTERLKFRYIEWSDLIPIHDLHTLPETDEFNTLGIPKNIEETKSVIDPWIADSSKTPVQNHTFVIETKAKSQFIGLIAIKLGNKKSGSAEVWYKLCPAYWGKGHGTESLDGILSYGFGQLHLHRICAGCAVDNTRSVKVLEKVGMTKEGRHRKILPLKSGWSDNFEYAMLASDQRTQNSIPFTQNI